MSIAAVLVNHNTSAFAELAIRSLFVQNPGLDLTLTVYDNGSTDDRSGMLTAAKTYGAQVTQSGFPTSTPGNSHGEVLRRFVLNPANDQTDHFLFLDADICFTHPGTIAALMAELMTKVMRTHGLRHLIADNTLIMHAFAVSYPDESSALIPQKEHRRDAWLTIMRQR
ncbi:glycosyltransferase family 2 protein [Phytoactinopolyspora endophytica]|uniref:glycosyltransferase family 2 protein n=1 Tax=Phytoactinopolyspora endophytica TaxID=1642495 RepID=UPI00101B6932|nr:hypothetical protein [Phytoactinopolyspora endophytica]